MTQSNQLIACSTEDQIRRIVSRMLTKALGNLLHARAQRITKHIVGTAVFSTDSSINFFVTLMPPYNRMARTVAGINSVQ